MVHLLPHNVDLWRATLTQQRVQRWFTGVTQVWCQRGGWELCVLEMGGVQTLLIWAAMLVSWLVSKLGVMLRCFGIILVSVFFRAFRGGNSPPPKFWISPPNNNKFFFFWYSSHFLSPQKQFPPQNYISRKDPDPGSSTLVSSTAVLFTPSSSTTVSSTQLKQWF